MTPRKKTSTSSFGSTKRESHDSRAFYARHLQDVKEEMGGTISQVHVPSFVECASSEHMTQLPDNSVALAVTSPPYHVGKDYDSDSSFEEYLELLQRVFAETHRTLEPGGRLAVNLANLGRKPYINLVGVVDGILRDQGYMARGQVVWVKAQGSSGSCAFGSYMKASNPVLRDLHEMILIYSKDRWGRARTGESTISKDDFLQNTLSVWYMRPESAKRAQHPAPFPLELPRRLIDLYTYKDDLVLDPFMGVGTTCVAALRAGRRYAGYDTDPGYVKLANERIAKETP